MINIADITSKNFGESFIEKAAVQLERTGLLTQFLTAAELVRLSEASKVMRQETADARNKLALETLLAAVVFGNEDLARKIIILHPELLLDSSATVTDISGKKIKDLTPLQAAICAGDVDMVQMIKKVLLQKSQNGVQLSFEPEAEIKHQFTVIYPDGIGQAEAAQQAAAEAFEASSLRIIFDAINAASSERVKFELDTPGQIHNEPGDELNKVLHKFRIEFSATSNQEQIFNPFYLLAAFDFHAEQFDNFNGNAESEDQWNRRILFWRQVIGYTQRHLPACCLQAFAQGIYYLVEEREKFKRDFEFRIEKGTYMRPDLNDLMKSGHVSAGVWGDLRSHAACVGSFGRGLYLEFLRTKKSGLEDLFARRDSRVSLVM